MQNCHPPKSMPIVQKILDDFKSGRKDHEDFWINMGGKTVYIRYFAIRDEYGKYEGTLEISQEISGIKGLEGEKRMMS
ncbi:MAG TPA: PAS domain-containing protein [Bacillota bacterium]|nr:PAS domain-containing protein [Bacillota bacterium]